jgi:hypothetical protein
VAAVLVLLAAAIVIVGLGKVVRTARPHGVPWGSLALWAVLFGAGLSIWILAAR